jgi:protein-S-isoprenylcysteine O-methyltransferase Ste14
MLTQPTKAGFDEFQCTTLVLLALLLATMLPARIRSGKSGISQFATEGPLIFWMLRGAALANLAAIILHLFFPNTAAIFEYPLSNNLRRIGGCLSLLSLAPVFLSARALGRNLTDSAGVKQNASLVTTGVYRYSRNPLYVFWTSYMVGVAMVGQNLLMLCSTGLLLIAIRLRLKIEESELLKHFGPEFESYCQRTGRFFPRFQKRRKRH